ncbi:MAG: hypothetical protein QM638_11130 [Nocardioides sp.]|uniref:hypothetical protein n=1 Tax=Nocardioides sp. TaxID=35761 RepID=UPI0039E6C130
MSNTIQISMPSGFAMPTCGHALVSGAATWAAPALAAPRSFVANTQGYVSPFDAEGRDKGRTERTAGASAWRPPTT